MVTDPDAPKGPTKVEDVRVAFHPKDSFGLMKIPPVVRGNAERTVEVFVSKVVRVSTNVEYRVVVGEAGLDG